MQKCSPLLNEPPKFLGLLLRHADKTLVQQIPDFRYATKKRDKFIEIVIAWLECMSHTNVYISNELGYELETNFVPSLDRKERLYFRSTLKDKLKEEG